MASQPDLKITNPYSLDQTQFDAAVALLKAQKPLIGEYWADYLKYEEAVTKGSLVLGTTWRIITNTLQAAEPPVPVEAVLPKEGSTAWSDNWMISSEAAHPNCMYKWINYITSPGPQAQVVEYFGEAPANLKACDETTDPDALRPPTAPTIRRSTRSSGSGSSRRRSASTAAATSASASRTG